MKKCAFQGGEKERETKRRVFAFKEICFVEEVTLDVNR